METEIKPKPKIKKPEPDKYSFDEENHIHMLGDKPLMGVTTVLSVISKPALIQWSANTAVNYVQEHLIENGISTFGTDRFNEILNEAKVAHKTKKETAGDWGTILHKAIENWIKKGEFPEEIDNFEALRGFTQFVIWAEQRKVKFIESEKHVWSKELWIGGIVDMIIEVDGKRYICDIKTSSGIYNEAFFQMGAYDLCLQEMGIIRDKKLDGYLVINLKKDGTMDTQMATDMELNCQAFKNALGLYKIINSLK